MTDFVDAWQAWRDSRERRLRDPHGWLAITAIHWLDATPERFDDAPGTWCHDERGPVVVLDEGETLTTGDVVLAAGSHALGQVDEDGTTYSFGDATVEVADRDGRTIVRPRHPDAPILSAYRGTPCYPPDPAWAFAARVDGDQVMFTYDGAEHRLVAWPEPDGYLWILFRDATSGVTTYAAMRQLLTAPPAADGTVTVDFNRAGNMPCTYTDFATCPVAPPGNTLPFAVEAGEQDPARIAGDGSGH
ncbi:DUF1684 domain-containing protein [Nocardioides mangrovi]|uniref:DUF1684 domain-containing protein n=1 Tax=Nocardioides mangrovi TaxID=2874580 RepID=A0ABS7UER1_9ACTN|nr:DUF1684 domain-containing protein [Nocardioides mangrovi]MBZ5739488.1 DUF1684 domain-containing protein [Nocardioides mangrovi]